MRDRTSQGQAKGRQARGREGQGLAARQGTADAREGVSLGQGGRGRRRTENSGSRRDSLVFLRTHRWKQAPHVGEYRLEHRNCQPPSIRIVTRAMVTVGKKKSVSELVNRAMTERVARSRLAERRQHAAMSGRAEGENDTQPGHRGDFVGQKWPAGEYFFPFGLVLGRHAADGVGDPAIDEEQTVIRSRTIAARGKSVLD